VRTIPPKIPSPGWERARVRGIKFVSAQQRKESLRETPFDRLRTGFVSLRVTILLYQSLVA
jgi:hypothetical protein